MTREAFLTVNVNDKLRVGGRSKIRGEFVLVREKLGNYIRVIDKRCETRLFHHKTLTLGEKFQKGE